MTARISPHTSNILDLARAAAAGLVVLSHAKIYTLGVNSPSGVSMIPYSITTCGTQAVFWFFVISGYLVGGSALIDIQAKRFSFRHYFVNRMARLYIVLLPALALGGLLDSLRVEALGLNYHAGFETTESLTPMTLLGNILFLETILVPTFGSNYSLWTLACEFWYYLIFPLLLAPLMTTKTWPSRLVMFSCGIVLYLLLMRQNGDLAWLFAVWCIGVGVRVWPYCLVKSEVLAWLGAVAAMLLFPVLHPILGPLTTLMVAITFACAVNASHKKKANWKYGGIVKNFGAFSYSLYMIHLPIQHFFLTMTRHDAEIFLSLSPSSLMTIAVIVGLVTACYIFAFAFSLVTERHTQWLRDRLFGLIDRVRLAAAPE